MSEGYRKLIHFVNRIREKVPFQPEIGLVLGSGLGDYAKNMEVQYELHYSELKDFPVSTVSGHDGAFLFGTIKGLPAVLMKGRIHYYEGYEMSDVVLPIRIMGLLGVKKLILTNAAGGVNLDFKPGDLMLITDHISAFVKSPLIGENLEELGVRFPDMSMVYDRDFCASTKKVAEKLNIPLKEGVYTQFSGPNYETPAEIKMFRTLGTDAVGMSTVCEAIAARHMGIRVCGISCITNMASGILDQPLDHKEVQEVAGRVKDKFERLITELILTI